MESALKSFTTTVVTALVVGAFLLTPAVVDGKQRVKKTVTLEAGQALVLAVEGDLAACKPWTCLVTLQARGSKEPEIKVKVKDDGTWVAFSQEEEDEEDGDDDDSAGDDDDSSEDWQAKAVLTDTERTAKHYEKKMGEYTVEEAKGTLADGEGGRVLSIPSEHLPSGDFYLGTNGYFGVSYDGVKVGSGKRSGVFRVKR
jgi:hypothetical protein